MTATFPYFCDNGASPSLEPSRKVVKFGDGYEHRSSSNLNPFLATWELTFSARSQAEAQAISGWFSANQAHVTPFFWDPTWWDNTAQGELIGIGTVAEDQSQYQLTKNGIAVVREITASLYIDNVLLTISEDYSLSSTGLVELASNLGKNEVLRWSGTGKTALMWIADKWSPARPDSYNSWSVTATLRQVVA